MGTGVDAAGATARRNYGAAWATRRWCGPCWALSAPWGTRWAPLRRPPRWHVDLLADRVWRSRSPLRGWPPLEANRRLLGPPLPATARGRAPVASQAATVTFLMGHQIRASAL